MKSISWIFGIFAALFATASYAQFTPGVFSYGNGDILFVIMQGAADILNSNAFRRIIGFFLLVLMIFSISSSFTSGRLKPELFLYWIFGATFMYTVILNTSVAKMDIVIHDLQGTDFATNRVVPDVPIYIAFPAVVTSEMGRIMTELVERTYSGFLPDELRMREMGRFNLGAQIVEDMGQITFTDPPTIASFNTFMRDCVIPEIYMGTKTINQILTSDNIIRDLAPTNLARLTFFYGTASPELASVNSTVQRPDGTNYPTEDVVRGQGVLVSCDHSWRKQEERFQVLGPSLLSSLNSSMVYQSQLLDDAVSNTALWVYGEGANRGTDGGGAKIYTRAAVANMFTSSAKGVITESGEPGLIEALGTAEAQATQKQNWIVSASVFSNMFSYLFAVIQTFFYAIAPFVLVLFVIPKIGGKAIFSFFGLMIWLSLWEPFMAIVHFISLFWMKSLAAKGSALLDPATSLQESLSLTPASMAYMTEAGSTLRAATDFLATMVPILTYGLVKGGELAFTNFVKDAAAPSASAKVAGNIATDSFSYGSRSLNNTSGNKYDLLSTMAYGQRAIEYDASPGSANQNNDEGGRTLKANGVALSGKTEEKREFSDAEKAQVMSQVAQQKGKSISVADAENLQRMLKFSDSDSFENAESAMSQLQQNSGRALEFSSARAREAALALKAGAENSTSATGKVTYGAQGALAIIGAVAQSAMKATGKDLMNLNDGDLMKGVASLALDAKKAGMDLKEYLSDISGGSQKYETNEEAAAAAVGQVQVLQETVRNNPDASLADSLAASSVAVGLAGRSKEEIESLDQEGFFSTPTLKAMRDSALSGRDALLENPAALLPAGRIGPMTKSIVSKGKDIVQSISPVAKIGTRVVGGGAGLVTGAKGAVAAGVTIAGFNRGAKELGIIASNTVDTIDINKVQTGSDESAGLKDTSIQGTKANVGVTDVFAEAIQQTRKDIQTFTNEFGKGSTETMTKAFNAGITANDLESISSEASLVMSNSVTEGTGSFTPGLFDDRARNRPEALRGIPNSVPKMENPNINRDDVEKLDSTNVTIPDNFDPNNTVQNIENNAPRNIVRDNPSVANNVAGPEFRQEQYGKATDGQKAKLENGKIVDDGNNIDPSAKTAVDTFLMGSGINGERAAAVLSGIKSNDESLQRDGIGLMPEGTKGFRRADFIGTLAVVSGGEMGGEGFVAPEGKFTANNGGVIEKGFIMPNGAGGQMVAYPGQFTSSNDNQDLRQLLEDGDMYQPAGYRNLSPEEKANYTAEDYDRDIATDMAVQKIGNFSY